jgi:hypothetical protein
MGADRRARSHRIAVASFARRQAGKPRSAHGQVRGDPQRRASAAEKSELSEQQQSQFMDAWGAWARTHQSALLDPGAPLYLKKRVTARGVEDFTDAKVAYCIVEAASFDEAVRVLAEHPHVTLMEGNSVDVLECPAPPA